MAAYRLVYDSRHLQADCQEPGNQVWVEYSGFSRRLVLAPFRRWSDLLLFIIIIYYYLLLCSLSRTLRKFVSYYVP